MKLHILSDLHNEFGMIQLQPVACDVVILAGDIDRGIRGAKWIADIYPHTPVLYVPGNHEYYGKQLPKVQKQLAELAHETNVYLLDNGELIWGHVRFLGCTLWTDFRLFGLERKRFAVYEAQHTMNDYARIRMGAEYEYRKIRPVDTIHFHQQSVSYLETKLGESFEGVTVVVTHHAPSPQSLSPYFKDDLVSAAYCSHLEELIRTYRPAMWIHGHTHEPVDYHIGRTRILCNPRGYAPNEIVEKFQPDFVMEI